MKTVAVTAYGTIDTKEAPEYQCAENPHMRHTSVTVESARQTTKTKKLPLPSSIKCLALTNRPRRHRFSPSSRPRFLRSAKACVLTASIRCFNCGSLLIGRCTAAKYKHDVKGGRARAPRENSTGSVGMCGGGRVTGNSPLFPLSYCM